MIHIDTYSNEQIVPILQALTSESSEAREAVIDNSSAIMDDAFAIANFLQMLFPRDDIMLHSRLYHVVINMNGTIFVFDIYPRNLPECTIHQSWSVIAHRSVMEMTPQGRDILGRQFNWKHNLEHI